LFLKGIWGLGADRMQSGGTFDCWGAHLSASILFAEKGFTFLCVKRTGDGETGQGCPDYGSLAFLVLFDENLFAGWEPECLDRK
jgi:hypothetical protein